MLEISNYPLPIQLLLGAIGLVLSATIVLFALGLILEFIERARDFLNIGPSKVCMNCVYWDTGIDDRSKTTSVGYCRFNAPAMVKQTKSLLRFLMRDMIFQLSPSEHYTLIGVGSSSAIVEKLLVVVRF